MNQHGPSPSSKICGVGNQCKVFGCSSRIDRGGYCGSHRLRFLRYGDPLLGPPIKKRVPPGSSEAEAFAFYMGPTPPDSDDCWEWRGTICNHGYGSVMIAGRNILAHRISYRIFIGELETELLVRHSCDNKPCVNPRHLSKGTTFDNSMDCVSRLRHAYGNRQPHARLNPEKVRELRELQRSGYSQSMLARHFGVGTSTVQAVIDGRTWKEVV